MMDLTIIILEALITKGLTVWVQDHTTLPTDPMWPFRLGSMVLEGKSATQKVMMDKSPCYPKIKDDPLFEEQGITIRNTLISEGLPVWVKDHTTLRNDQTWPSGWVAWF